MMFKKLHPIVFAGLLFLVCLIFIAAMYALGVPEDIRTIINLALGGVSGIVFFNWLQGRGEE